MKFSNLSFFNSRGEELKTDIFFNISWTIDELLLTDDSERSCKVYPSGYIDGDSNFIVTDPGVIHGSHISRGLWENGYIIFNPRINNDNWQSDLSNIASDIKYIDDAAKRAELIKQNPLIVKISDLFPGRYDKIRFDHCMSKFEFSTSEMSDELDINKTDPGYYILDKLENDSVDFKEKLSDFWTFIDTWYNNGDSENNWNYPYWHFESAVSLEPVSVGLVSPMSIYILEEYETNKFRMPYVELEEDDEGNEIVTSLYFSTDNEGLRIFTNNYDNSEIEWHQNITCPLTIQPLDDYIEPLTLHVGFMAEEEGLYMDELRIYIKRQNLAKEWTTYHYIGTIRFKEQAIGQDERYRTLFTNFGIPDPINYQHVFKEYDPLEEGTDYELINRKSKELFLSYDKIFPYVGTYKALINAVKFLGYNDIYFKEWYRLINDEDNHNVDTLNYVSIDMHTGETLQSKLKRFGLTYEEYLNMKKLNRLTMVYHFNMEDLANDDSVKLTKVHYHTDGYVALEDDKTWKRSLDFPKVIKNFDYSQTEMLAKLFYLKKWLEKYIIGVNCRIIDITGEGIYFENLKNNAYAIGYMVNDMQKEYSLTPYNIYEEDGSTGVKGAVMRNSEARVTASLKEYDYTKISDIGSLKFSDFIKYYVNIGSPLADIEYILWSPEESKEYDEILSQKKYKSEDDLQLVECIDAIQLFGAPFAAPFILDEYSYELKTVLPTSSMIELNDGWDDIHNPESNNYAGNLKDNTTLFINNNEIYISDPSSNSVTWTENAPYIKVDTGNLRDITTNRWNNSLRYGIKEVFDASLNRYIHKLHTYDKTPILNIISDDYIILAPVQETDLPYSKKYQTGLNGLKSWWTDEQKEVYLKNLVKECSGIFKYSEDNFYEAPMISLNNYKIMWTEEGLVKTLKDEDGNLMLIGDDTIGNLVLEIIEGKIDSKEIRVDYGDDIGESLLTSLYFSNDSIDINTWSLLNGYTVETIPNIPTDMEYGDNILLDNEQWIYPEFTYKTHRQKFYEILANIYNNLKRLNQTSRNSRNNINMKYNLEWEDEYENLKQQYKDYILKDIPEEDKDLYWKDSDESVFDEYIENKKNLKKYMDIKKSFDYYYNSNSQKISYNDGFLEYVNINKETDITVNRLGKYILSAKGYDAFNNIFLNSCEDYVIVGGEKPDMNAYTVYDSIKDYEEYNLEKYNGIKCNEQDKEKFRSELYPKFPKSYRLYGIDYKGEDEIIKYDNVSYIYDTFKANDYVIFNNFTNRIYGGLPDISTNEGGTIKLWKQNYNLNSLNSKTKAYFGIVFYNEEKMQLYYDKPIIVQGKGTSGSSSSFYNYKIKYIYNKDEKTKLYELISAYNRNNHIKAFLININQYEVLDVSINSETGNTLLLFNIGNGTMPVFSSGQVVKLIYTKAKDPVLEWGAFLENEYIASTSYRIKDAKMTNIVKFGEDPSEEETEEYDGRPIAHVTINRNYIVQLELDGRINTNLLLNHYYNNYLTKYVIAKDSDNRNFIKELIETLNLTICYANLAPVSYIERLKYDGWEESLTLGSLVIDKNYMFLNDYIDSGYSAYRMEFDPVNALNVWADENYIKEFGMRTSATYDLDLYKYPQDQGTVINKGDFIILDIDDKNKVFNENQIYYEWEVYNNFIKNNNNLLYKFINKHIFIKPEFYEKYNVTAKMRDIYGNVITNKSNAKFFVK